MTVVGLDGRNVTVPWYTWYKIRCFALHEKRTHHGQLRSIVVCYGQPKTPIMLRQFVKVQVADLGAIIFAGSNPVVRSKEPQVRHTF